MKKSDWIQKIITAIEKDGRTPRSICVAADLGPNYIEQLIKRSEKTGADPCSKLFRLMNVLNVNHPSIFSDADLATDDEEILYLFSKLDKSQRENLLRFLRSIN